MLLPLLSLAWLPLSSQFVAYQCDENYKGFMEFSALSVETCDLDQQWLSDKEEQMIQVLQTKYSEETQMLTCSIKRTLEIGKCGIFGLSYGVPSKPVIIINNYN